MTQKIRLSESQKEVWLPIAGYEGFYEVSSFGRVKSIYDENNCLKRMRSKSREFIMKLRLNTRKHSSYATYSVGL